MEQPATPPPSSLCKLQLWLVFFYAFLENVLGFLLMALRSQKLDFDKEDNAVCSDHVDEMKFLDD